MASKSSNSTTPRSTPTKHGAGASERAQASPPTLPPADVARFDKRMAQMLAQRVPEDPLVAPHRVFAAIGTTPLT